MSNLYDVAGYNPLWHDGLDILYPAPVDRIQSERGVEILLEAKIIDDNIWNANIEITIFRIKDNGWLGYRHETPAGYSSYTYDPIITSNIYNKTDLDWLWSFALTDDIRGYEPVARWMSTLLIEKLLTAE